MAMKDGGISNGRRRSWRRNDESLVQWKQTNVKEGFVVVDELQLSKLIKREPIDKFYKLEDNPFATGLFASVRRCISHTTGEQFAAKFSNRKRYGEDCSAEIYHEIALLSLCGSAPRIIQIHDVFENPKEIILVMEYAPGGDLQTIIDDNQVPYESDVVTYIRQCVEGLEYLHQRKIAHLDIKPQNIVMMGKFPNCDIKLCDLEISRVILDGNSIREILGTPDYVAPEILHYDPITHAADMWSLGVTAYVLLTGFSPFGGETDQETFCNISRGEVDLNDELFEDISENAKDFLRKLLLKNPRARLTASQCLKHPWLATSKAPAPPPSPSSLRKYLSKSREALFDRVVQQHRNSLRKHTLQRQMIRTTRLYESQMSLVSKSREKILRNESMLPSFSRSIEKIYGLRSLSKSQEVLNLYKNGNLMTSQENINNVVTEILKSRENLIEKDDPKEKKLTRATTADLGILRHRNRKILPYSGSSTTSLASDLAEEREDRMGDAAMDEGDFFNVDERLDLNECSANGSNENQNKIGSRDRDKNEDEDEHSKKVLENGSSLHVDVNISQENKSMDVNEKESQKGSRDLLKIPLSSSDKSEEKGLQAETEKGVEEPKFTVAQLITAFNKHQDVVTKTSLEVTMLSQLKEVKIPQRRPYSEQVPFPTGPTALRLFIPDIDLVEMPKRVRPRHSIKMNQSNPAEECQTAPIVWATTPTLGETTHCKTFPDLPTYLRSASLSSDTSTAVSLEDTTPDTSLELVTDNVEAKPPITRPSSLKVSAHRSKSQSPSPVSEPDKTQQRKLSAGSYNEPRREPIRKTSGPVRKLSIEKSPVPQRKLSSVERSPVPQRKKLESPVPARKLTNTAPEFKIVGLGERNRKGHGISYKIEFASPVVSRRFPVRTPGVCAKTTISSELKKQDTINKVKRK